MIHPGPASGRHPVSARPLPWPEGLPSPILLLDRVGDNEGAKRMYLTPRGRIVQTLNIESARLAPEDGRCMRPVPSGHTIAMVWERAQA